MWTLRSLCVQTDVFLTDFDGAVTWRERYLVLRTPRNPDYWWGNFLLYPEPPTPRDAAPDGWRADFARELPECRATLLAWDRPDGAAGDALEPFTRDGFAVDVGTVLTTRAVHRPPRINDDASVEALRTEAHWRDAARVLTHAFAARHDGELEGVRGFVERQLARYRAMQARGLGRWYGAWLDGQMAAALGVVRVPTADAGTVGRFQLVGTDPAFGRRGACSTLVYEAAQRTLADAGVSTLVMAADESYHAARVYESVGFRPTERLVALLKRSATS